MNCTTVKVKNKIGIYKITNTDNNKCYIGQSVHMVQRLGDHKRNLRKGEHINEYFQRAYNKYGIDKFVYEVIEECDKEQLNDKELFWIDLFNSTDRGFGYNLMDGGNERGSVHKNTKHKMSLINRGINNILTEHEVMGIKEALLKGITQTELSLRYGVSQSGIWRIMNLDNWVWVSPELNEQLKSLPIRLKEERDNKIKALTEKGWAVKKIASHLGINERTVSNASPSTYVEDHKRVADLVREDHKNYVPISETLSKYGIKRSTYSKHTRELRHQCERELHEEVIRMNTNGVMVKDIAATLGIHRTTVTDHIKGRSKGNRRKDTVATEELKQTVISKYSNGQCQSTIALDLNISIGTVKKIIIENKQKGIS